MRAHYNLTYCPPCIRWAPSPLPPTWPVSDFILIRSVIIARASGGENSSRGAHWERRDARGPEGATSWPASFTNNLIRQLSRPFVPHPSPPHPPNSTPSQGTRLRTPRAGSLLSAAALIKLSLLQARLVGKLILSNYTDVTAAFQRVIKIWPASFAFILWRARKEREREREKLN